MSEFIDGAVTMVCKPVNVSKHLHLGKVLTLREPLSGLVIRK